MDDYEDEKRKIATNLRSVTQSCKGGVPIERLERDYNAMIGTPIPYRSMGFNSLDAFLHSMPSVIRTIRNNTGQLLVLAVADESTSHIAKLVANQRYDKKSKQPKYRMPSRMSSYASSSNRSASYQRTPSTRPAWAQWNTQRKQMSVSPKSPPKQQSSVPKRVRFAATGYEVPPRFKKLMIDHIKGNSEKDSTPQVDKSPYNNIGIRIPKPELEANIPSPPQLEVVILPPSPPKARPGFPNPPSLELKRPCISPPKPILKIPISQVTIESPIPKAKTIDLKPQKHIPKGNNLSDNSFVAEYAKLNNLELTWTVKSFLANKKNKNKSYIAMLKLGDKTYQSYPNEKPTENEAKAFAAHCARADIESRATEVVYESVPIETMDDINKFLSGIEELVKEKPFGIWSDHCAEQFKLKFHQTVPDQWLVLLKTYRPAVIEMEIPDRVNHLKKACILRYCDMLSGISTPLNFTNRSPNKTDDNLNSESKVFTEIQDDVKDLSVENDNFWPVFVTFVSTTERIAVRMIEDDAAFIELSDRMTTFYSTRDNEVECLEQQKLYVVNTGNNCWHRVRLDDYYSSISEALCYFVDIGETAMINITRLQEIEPEFEQLPYQAVIFKLSGLEEYKELVKLEYLDSFILDRTFIAEIITNDSKGTSVVLYDTSSDVDINVNEYLKQVTIEACFDYDMPESDSTSMAYLTNVTEVGDVFLRIYHPCIGLLEYEMDKLTSKFEKEVSTNPVKILTIDKMYVAKYVDGIWYRALAMELSETNSLEVEVYFVDYGNTSFVPINALCELDPISKTLAEIPFQAITCVLNNVPPSPNLLWTEDAVNKVYELVPDNEQVILKVNRPATNKSPAVVSLFIRNESSAIISINDTLVFNNSLFRKKSNELKAKSLEPGLRASALPKKSDVLSKYIPDVAVSAEARMAGRDTFFNQDSNNHNEYDLAGDRNPPPPIIPNVDEMFSVYIPLATSPSNFVVQPLDVSRDLGKLQDEMLQFYSDKENHRKMGLSNLKMEKTYSSLHTDDLWYRARLKGIEVGDPIMVAVHYVDYGDNSLVPLANLQPLCERFKTLPCQAIKASLSGVRPCVLTWSNEECHQFCNYVQERSFISVVKKKNQNYETDFREVTLELVLIDTSQPNIDVVIHEELIKNHLALKAKK